jgi:uncharacterized protein
MTTIETPPLTSIIWELFQKLRRRGFTIGIEEYQALQHSLRIGFGWQSREEFIKLCNSLWSKSLQERKTLSALFEQLLPNGDEWVYSVTIEKDIPDRSIKTGAKSDSRPIDPDLPIEPDSNPEEEDELNSPLKTKSLTQLPEIDLDKSYLANRKFVLVPEFPLSYREVAQTWRRLQKLIRMGAVTELDLEATIDRRCRSGVPTPVVMRPRRRNIARLLLLVDRQGSMAPFHRFGEEVCRAIQQSGRLGETSIYYFHNVPVEGADDRVLEPLAGQLFPALDPILGQIEPLKDGYVYTDPDLLSPKSFSEVLESDAVGASVVILSDAGAARRQYRVSRLLDTIACMKAIRTYSPNYVWLNPLAPEYWRNNTAGQIARHIPMFPLDRQGLERAVSILQGHQRIIEKSI